jgi:hypothetical protein
MIAKCCFKRCVAKAIVIVPVAERAFQLLLLFVVEHGGCAVEGFDLLSAVLGCVFSRALLSAAVAALFVSTNTRRRLSRRPRHTESAGQCAHKDSLQCIYKM